MNLINRVRLWRAALAAERRISDELSTYSERELSELGLRPGDIAGIAREGRLQMLAQTRRPERDGQQGPADAGLWTLRSA